MDGRQALLACRLLPTAGAEKRAETGPGSAVKTGSEVTQSNSHEQSPGWEDQEKVGKCKQAPKSQIY